ncbi:MAG TPA: alanine racemase [Chloroflexota bacterium]|nr:alanine racemase [Chloroflexota bacterium]
MIQLADLLEAMAPAGARLVGPAAASEFDGFAYDSRKLRPGELFLAVRTARADGHDYIVDAIRRGAAGVIGDRLGDEAARLGVTALVVEDTQEALRAWARWALARYAPRVVGVVGGVGKTSAAKAVAGVLGHGVSGAPTVFDGDNHNTFYGLSIALGELDAAHQVAVLELAGDEPGDRVALAELTRPTTLVVVSAYDSDALNQELAAVMARVPYGGHLILNADDARLLALFAATRERVQATVLRYGHAPSADVSAEAEAYGLSGTRFVLSLGAPRVVRLGLLGTPGVSAALAAAAVGLVHGFHAEEIVAGLERLIPLPGRLRPLPGPGGSTILDDTFDASVPSLDAALAFLEHPRALPPGGERVTVILGALSGPRVGDQASEGRYRRIGEALIARVDCLITVGAVTEPAALAALAVAPPGRPVIATDTPTDAVAAARANPQSGEVILVIGGSEARLERVVEGLLVEPRRATEVLVRQDPGWKRRVFLSQERPTWVEVDLAAIGHNVGRLKAIAAPAALLAVLKADAYGHGAVRVARTALLHGAEYLATACLSEAVTLRGHGIGAPILILGFTPPWQATEIVRYHLTATVYNLETARHLARAARLRGDGPAKVHVKVDTGMGRLGLLPDEVPAFLAELRALEGIEVEGIFTHFACADGPDPFVTERQIDRFNQVLDQVTADGWRPRHVHAANSAGILRFPSARYTMVRAGLALYGLDPSEIVRCPADFRHSLTFKTLVAQVKSLPPGSPISYGGTFVTERDSRIAVLPVGYGDGFRRAPRNWGNVLIRGQRAPIVGVVCMDMCMIDVTDVPGVRAGDEVVLIGSQGADEITVAEVAERLGTIPYEVITQILARVPREIAPGS